VTNIKAVGLSLHDKSCGQFRGIRQRNISFRIGRALWGSVSSLATRSIIGTIWSQELVVSLWIERFKEYTA
jgi:hypothetical protein